MIRIHKPSQPPTILQTRGLVAAQAHCMAYTIGQRKFDFDRAIYGDATVRDALAAAQHGKCCFCESRIVHTNPGDVEHFRPKAAFTQFAGAALSQSGYYWLAYDWANLFLSCPLCNQRHKRNLFPLRNPGQRAINHTLSIANERPLFVNPATDDPLLHITFKKDVAVPVNGSRRGNTTIDALQLNRPALQKYRLDHLAELERLVSVRKLCKRILATGRHPAALCAELAGHLGIIKSRLAAACQPAAEYSAMARAFLRRK